MADSQVEDIYTAIKSMTVPLGTVTPEVRDIDELPSTAETAILPVRLLLPYGNFFGAGGQDFRYVTLDSITRVNWIIRDLLLVQPLGQGSGIAKISPVLIRYCGRYLTELTRKREITTQAYVGDRVAIRPGLYEYPDASDRWYYGVEALVDIVEIIS